MANNTNITIMKNKETEPLGIILMMIGGGALIMGIIALPFNPPLDLTLIRVILGIIFIGSGLTLTGK